MLKMLMIFASLLMAPATQANGCTARSIAHDSIMFTAMARGLTLDFRDATKGEVSLLLHFARVNYNALDVEADSAIIYAAREEKQEMHLQYVLFMEDGCVVGGMGIAGNDLARLFSGDSM